MGIWAYPAWVKKLPIYLILAVVTSIYLLQQNNLKNVIDIDTQYNRALIFETTNGTSPQPIRILKLNTEYHSAMYVNSDDLAVEYTKFYRLAKYYNPNIKSALMIGGGAFSYPKDFLSRETSATMDVVEIDPGITEIAKKHFRLQDSNRLQIFHEDGRTYLNRNQKKYDAIFIDAFLSYYSIPFQMTTVEAVRHIDRSLSKDGVVMINVVTAVDGDKGKFLRALRRTYKTVFDNIEIYPVERKNDGEFTQNIMLVAWNNEQPSNVEMNEELSYFLSHRWNKPIPEDMPILTDEFAPVDQYVASLLE